MRASHLVLALGLSAAACQKTPAEPPPTPSPSAQVVEVNRQVTVPDENETSTVTVTPVEPGHAPKGCPAWTAVTACTSGGFAYAVGAVQGIRDPNLALSTARNRATAKLVSGNGTVNGSSVAAQARCAHHTFALIRAAREGLTVGACDDAATAALQQATAAD